MVGIPPNNPLKDLEMPYPRAEALGFRNQLPPRANALGFQKKISVGRHRRETPLVSPGGSANQEPPFSPPTGGSTGTARSLGRPRRIALRPRIWTSATTDPRLSRFTRIGPTPRADPSEWTVGGCFKTKKVCRGPLRHIGPPLGQSPPSNIRPRSAHTCCGITDL